jgi:hypothetical protein
MFSRLTPDGGHAILVMWSRNIGTGHVVTEHRSHPKRNNKMTHEQHVEATKKAIAAATGTQAKIAAALKSLADNYDDIHNEMMIQFKKDISAIAAEIVK